MDIIEANQNPRDKKNSVEEISFKESKAKNANNNIYIFEEKNDINNNIRNPVSEANEKKTLRVKTRSQTSHENEKSVKYFHDLLGSHKRKMRKLFLEKKVKSWIIVIYYLLSSFTNIFSVILFIIDSQISDQSTSKYVLLEIDFSIAIFFSIEFVISFVKSYKKLNHLVKFETILDLITIIPSYMNFLMKNVTINLSFMRIFRVLRVLRVLRLLKYVNMLRSDNEGEIESGTNSGIRISKVNKQIISFIVALISTIFVSAGTVTILQNYIPDSFNVDNLTFIDAVYFIIVTSSTLGYGDIVPTNTISRMFIIILLIFLIYFFSEQIASIVTLLRITDNSEVSIFFENHNIIIGDLSVEGIKIFLDEFYEIFNLNVKLKTKPYSVILLDEKNANIRDNLSLEPYGNKVHFLVTKNYSIEAFMKSNFEEAESIICLNQNYTSNPWITDKINDFTLELFRYI